MKLFSSRLNFQAILRRLFIFGDVYKKRECILFALFIKTLLFFLPHVQETKCEIRRSADHPAKTERFNVARDNFLMSQKLSILKSQKLRV